jgi:maleate isomerase
MPLRLGMLIPSSNTVVEPETARLLPPGGPVVTHVSRLRVVQISDDASSLSQFELQTVLQAADLLADALVDLILWNGTSAGWLGFDWDRRLVEAIEAHTGIRATTAVTALNQALARRGARRIGLVTPYVAALEHRIIENYRGIGVTVASAIRSDLTQNTDYGSISPDEIADMVRKVARRTDDGPMDAIIILCTNLAGASVSEALSAELGIPVLDSVRVAIDHSLALLAT